MSSTKNMADEHVSVCHMAVSEYWSTIKGVLVVMHYHPDSVDRKYGRRRQAVLGTCRFTPRVDTASSVLLSKSNYSAKNRRYFDPSHIRSRRDRHQ